MARRKKNRKHSYRPSDRVVSFPSAVSSILGVVGILGYGLSIYMSVQAKGNGSVFLGLIGWLLLVSSVVGVVLATQSLKDTVSIMLWKVIGLATNSCVLLFSIVVFIRGVLA